MKSALKDSLSAATHQPSGARSFRQTERRVQLSDRAAGDQSLLAF